MTPTEVQLEDENMELVARPGPFVEPEPEPVEEETTPNEEETT